ncbi:MAG: acetyl-CoA C-acyltransferase, partial [Acidobacteria bacterium]
MKNVYLAGAVRTPIGRYGGALAGLTPAELGAIVAAESLRRARVEPGDVREVV